MRPAPAIGGLLVLLVIIAACARPATLLPAPTITSITPAAGAAAGGTEVTISGSGFFQVESGNFPASLAVSVCGVPLQAVRVHGTVRHVVLPGGTAATITYGSTIIGTTGTAAIQADGNVTVRRPDGQNVTLAGAFNCFARQPQITSFNAAPPVAVIGQPVTFSWEIDDPGNSGFTCSLDTGDGAGSSGACSETGAFTHAYASAGTYLATLSVTGSGTDPVEREATVTVTAQLPVAADDHYLATGGQLLVVDAPGVLLNDTAFDAVLAGPALSTRGGTVQLAEDGSFTYDAPVGFSGTDSFTYSLTNVSGAAEATVSLEVRTLPVAEDDAYSTGMDTELTVPAATGVLANDTGEPAPLVSVWTAAAHGAVTGNSDGSFSYVPEPGFTGADTFSYTVGNDAGSDSATVTVTVGVAPSATDDQYTALRDSLLTVAAPGVLGNDLIQGASLSHDTASAGGGVVVVLPDGSFSYQPAAGFTGQDHFAYVLDNALGSATAVVRIDVFEAPTAMDDYYVTGLDAELTVPAATGLLANDRGYPPPVAEAITVATAQGGTMSLEPSGEFRYTPAPGFTGTDSLGYSISNDAGKDNGTVFITVGTAPLAVDDSLLAHFAQQLDVPVSELLANDSVNGAVLSLLGTRSLQGGAVSLANDLVSYTPPAGLTGQDSFQYRLSNGLGESAGTVQLSIRRSPATQPDDYAAVAGVTLAIPAPGVLGNDLGYPALTVTPQSGLITALGGMVSLSGDGSFTYEPPAVTGMDSFVYSAGNDLGSDTATVSIDVRLLPVALPDSYAVPVGTPLNVTAPGLLQNDMGVPAPSVTPQSWSGANATLQLFSDGSFDFVPAPGFIGIETFSYGISNSAGAATGQVEFTVGQVPVGAADIYAVSVNTQLTVVAPGVLANDTRNGAAVLALTGHPTELGGTVDLHSDGSFIYQPPDGVAGTDSFAYQLRNGLGTVSVPVSISVDWTGPPVAIDDRVSTPAGVRLEVAAPGVRANDLHNHAPVSAFDPVSLNGGTVSVEPSGAYSYTPSDGYAGLDSFSYWLQNGLGSSMATVEIDVTAPVAAVDDAYETAIATSVSGNVLTNDSGWPRPQALLHTAPAAGTLMLNADGTFSYTPDAGFIGTETFTYQAFVTGGDSSSATVTIRVGSAPVASDDSYAIEETAAPSLLASVLNNDDRQLATFSSDALAGDQGGSILLASDGRFSYTPATGWLGEEKFTYTLANVFGTAHAQITVFTYQQPQAGADFYSTEFNTPLILRPLDNDTGYPAPVILSVNDTVAAGSAVLDRAAGTVEFTPASGFVGFTTLSYIAGNDYGTPVTADIQITVGRAPIAVADDIVLPANAASTIDLAGLLANDTFDGTPGIAVDATTLAGILDGWSYTPPAGFVGIDSFTYTLSNAIGSSTASVNIQILGPPVPLDDNYATPLRTDLTVAVTDGVLQNDGGYPRPAATPQTLTDLHGNEFVLASDGSFTFTPEAQFTGIASFAYEAFNPAGSGTASVHIAVGTPAVAVADDAGTTLGNVPGTLMTGAAAFNPLANDTGDLITLGSVDASSSNGGTITLDPDGSLLYLPPAGYTGPDSFDYTIRNGFGSSTGTISVSVQGMVWFVNAAGLEPGDGRLNTPFRSLNELPTLKDGNAVFFHEGTYSGASGLADGVRLIGQGASGSLAVLAGVTWPVGTAMPALLGPDAGQVTLNLGTTQLALKKDNQLHGLNISGTGARGPLLHGNTFGTLTVSHVSLNATGRNALDLANGTVAAQFPDISSSGGTAPVALSHVSGSMVVMGGSLSAADDALLSERCMRIRAHDGVSLHLRLETVAFQDCEYGLDVDANLTGRVRLDLQKLDMDVRGGGINVSAQGSATVDVRLLDSDLHTNVANNQAVGYWAVSTGNAAVVSRIEDSRFSGSSVSVYVTAREGALASTELTLLNSILTAGSSFPLAGLWVASGNGSAGEITAVCLNATGNSITASAPGAVADIFIEQYSGNLLRVPGYTGSAESHVQLASYLAGTNQGAVTLVDAYLNISSSQPCLLPDLSGGL